MAFDTYGTTQTEGSTQNTVDFDELNRYVVNAAALEQRETLTGVVSMLVDLGEQNLPDAEVVFTGSEEDERQEIAKSPNTYFKDGYDFETKKQARFKCWPQKPQQCVAFAIDFPDIIIDKGQFFGESKPLPLRLWMGGQFYIQEKGMVIGRPTPLKFTNLDKTRKTTVWSLAQNSLPYKMAVAAKLIKPGEAFLPQRIDELLGKAFQFNAQVFFKKSNNDKEYYTEYVNFAAALGRGQAVPELPFEPMMIQFNQENDEKAVKELRAHVVNTLNGCNNFEGSILQRQIDSVRGGNSSSATAPAPQETKKVDKPAEVSAPVDSFDDDIPF